MTTASTNLLRNPYLSKWNILFDKSTTPEWISFKPKLGLQVYPCYACRDMFGSRQSFIDHVNRRGMVLKYKCANCNRTDGVMIFYNPCSFLLHTRQHYSLLGGQVHLQNLEICHLPYGLGGLLPDPDVPLIYNVEDDSVGESSFINTRFYSPAIESRGNSVVNLVSNELLFFYSSEPTLVLKQVSSNIPRCRFVNVDDNRLTPIPDGVNINGRQLCANGDKGGETEVQIKEEFEIEHFRHDFPVIANTETVKERNVPPKNKSEHLKAALGEGMESYAQCPECGQVQTTSMGEHFLKTNKPSQESLKCTICKYIAPTKCSLKAHERIHDSLEPFVCPECGKTFDDWKFLHAHLEEVCFHLTKQVRFRCPGKKCGKIFAQTSTFSTHFIVHTPCLNKCTVCGESFQNQIEFLDHARIHENKMPPIQVFKCTACPDVTEIPPRQTLQDHILGHVHDRKQYLYVYICKHCHSYFRSTLTYATHLLRCVKLASHMNSSSVQTRRESASAANDLKRKHKPSPAPASLAEANGASEELSDSQSDKMGAENEGTISFRLRLDQGRCLLCERKLTVQETESHFRLKQCKFDNPIVVLDSEPILERRREKFEDNSNRRKRKKTPSTSGNKHRKLSTSISDTDLCTELEEPTPFDGTYHCKLCKCSNTIREDFHKHIRQHRDVCTAYQCMECGECFVVKPSLAKHLLYYHQITDAEKYFDENDCVDKVAVKELEHAMRLAPGESKGPVAENQCGVCLEQFSNSAEFNKHFRIHGMAFLLKNSK